MARAKTRTPRRRPLMLVLPVAQRPCPSPRRPRAPDDPPPIVRMQPRGQPGINRRQPLVKPFVANLLEPSSSSTRRLSARPPPAPQKAPATAPSGKAASRPRKARAPADDRDRVAPRQPTPGTEPRSPLPTGRPRRSGDAATPRRSSTPGFAVPMSMPRYSVIESIATTSAPSRCASNTPTAVFPEAVGPVR